MNVPGKVAIVTGAAAGIGRASAVALAQAGAQAVVVADVDVAGGEETARLVEKEGAEAAFVATDVADPAQVAALIAETEQRFGGLDILHNNAGLVSGNPPWPETPVERVQTVIGVNVGGVFYGTRLGVEAIAKRGGGAIVNTASVAGLGPMPPDAVYAATKAAIIYFTQSCLMIKDSHGVRVNAVLPGIVDTDMVKKTGDGTNPADWPAPLLSGIDELPLKAEHIAAAVLDLVRDDSKAGETVTVISPPE
jgi:3-oxoacyl-[acyl-carrier protein] reductase